MALYRHRPSDCSSMLTEAGTDPVWRLFLRPPCLRGCPWLWYWVKAMAFQHRVMAEVLSLWLELCYIIILSLIKQNLRISKELILQREKLRHRWGSPSWGEAKTLYSKELSRMRGVPCHPTWVVQAGGGIFLSNHTHK